MRNLMQSRIWLANGYLGELPIICNKLINNDYCVTEYGDIYNHVFGRLVVKTRVMKLNCNQFKSHKCQKKLSFGDMWSVILVSQGFLVIKLKSSPWLGLPVMESLCNKMCSVCRNHNPILSSFMTYQNKTRVTRRVPHVKQEQLTLPEFPHVFSGVCVA